MPDSLSSSQCEGALRRFWCFLLLRRSEFSSSRPGTAGGERRCASTKGLFLQKVSDGFSRGRTHIPRAMVSVGWLVDGVEEDGRGGLMDEKQKCELIDHTFFCER